ncbi:hypothetical protein GCM10027610_045620 [Dactylosporangium cerinum]
MQPLRGRLRLLEAPPQPGRLVRPPGQVPFDVLPFPHRGVGGGPGGVAFPVRLRPQRRLRRRLPPGRVPFDGRDREGGVGVAGGTLRRVDPQRRVALRLGDRLGGGVVRLGDLDRGLFRRLPDAVPCLLGGVFGGLPGRVGGGVRGAGVLRAAAASSRATAVAASAARVAASAAFAVA